MTITANASLKLFVKETLSAGVDGVANPVISHEVGADQRYSASTTPAASKFSFDDYPLSGGALTLDLTTSLLGVNGVTVNLDTLRPRVVYFKNNGAADMVIAKGASNGSDMFGSAWTITLRPGEELFRKLSSTGPTAVGAANKTIDITGTGTDALAVGILAG